MWDGKYRFYAPLHTSYTGSKLGCKLQRGHNNHHANFLIEFSAVVRSMENVKYLSRPIHHTSYFLQNKKGLNFGYLLRIGSQLRQFSDSIILGKVQVYPQSSSFFPFPISLVDIGPKWPRLEVHYIRSFIASIYISYESVR